MNASKQDRIRDEAARRQAAWQGPQSDNSAPNSLVVSTPMAGGGVGGLNSTSSGAMGGGYGGGGGAAPMRVGSSSGQPTLDGPLPKEARQLIQQAVRGEEADQAELYARRLLSTSRRVRIYKEELQAAREEVDDYKTCVSQQQLVVNGLSSEAQRIDEQIRALQQELHIARTQQEAAYNEQMRMQHKQGEAERRVEALQSTIDTIASESQRGKLLLRQLVPNLNIDNYAN